MVPVGLSALLEALKARMTSVLKFEGAEVILQMFSFNDIIWSVDFVDMNCSRT